MSMYSDTGPQNDSEAIRKMKVRLIKKVVTVAAAAILVVITISQMAFSVSEQEKAVIVTLGTPTSVRDSGLGFKIPFVQKLIKVNTTIKGFAVGYDEKTTEFTEDATMITKDYNFMNVDFFVEWSVTDPIKAIYNAEYPVQILSDIVQSSARAVIGTSDVDSVLTTGKFEIQNKIKKMVNESIDQFDLGLQVHNITMQDAEPPTKKIMEAFDDVEDARQRMATFTNEANKYKNEKIPAARAEADKAIRSAEADKEVSINKAKGEVAKFNEMYKEFIKNPTITKRRMFYETMEDVLPEMKVIIDDGHGGVQKFYPVESFAGGVKNHG